MVRSLDNYGPDIHASKLRVITNGCHGYIILVVMVTSQWLPCLHHNGCHGYITMVAMVTSQWLPWLLTTVEFIISIATIVVMVTQPGLWDTSLTLGTSSHAICTVGLCKYKQCINYIHHNINNNTSLTLGQES